jgi:hypothetical protein
VPELLLLLLAVYTMLLHQHHSEQQQQQPLQSSKQQLRANLLPIPAFHQHQDTLQLLPGGQAYLDVAGHAVTAAAAADSGSASDILASYLSRAQTTSASLNASLQYSSMRQQGSSVTTGNAPALSAAAVRLVLGLQLLAAGCVQRLQHQQQQRVVPEPQGSRHPFQLLLTSCVLQHRQLKAVLQASSSCLPPEVLQQAGLQLLQALAAPLQQLQLSALDSSWRAVTFKVAAGNDAGCPRELLLALRAAAAGVAIHAWCQ